MPKEPDKIYTEETVIIIAPLKARIFSEDYERIESYDSEGVKVILLREKVTP